MVAQTTNSGGIEHFLREEMKLWHALPIFIGLALTGMAFAHGVGFVVGADATTVTDLSTRMVGAAGLLAGALMGWTARRYQEEGKLGS